MKSKLAVISFLSSIIGVILLYVTNTASIFFGLGGPGIKEYNIFFRIAISVGVFLIISSFIGSIISLRKIKKENQDGKWMALAGLIISFLVILLSIWIFFSVTLA